MMAVLHIAEKSSHGSGGDVAIYCRCGWVAEADSFDAAQVTLAQHIRRQNAEAELRDTVDDPEKRVEL